MYTEAHRRYKQSKAGKIAAKRYKQSKVGRAAAKRYKQSKAGKAAAKRYAQSKLGRAAQKRRNQSKKGKTARTNYEQTFIGRLRRRFSVIKQRCNNPKHVAYKYYGGRGIELRFSSDSFVSYVIDVLQIDPRGLTIDRIDNNGHYEPGNIRFVTQTENNKNRRKRQ